MQLLYDPRDDAYHEKVGSRINCWLDDLLAESVDEADPARDAFLFAGARSIADYRTLVATRLVGIPLHRHSSEPWRFYKRER